MAVILSGTFQLTFLDVADSKATFIKSIESDLSTNLSDNTANMEQSIPPENKIAIFEWLQDIWIIKHDLQDLVVICTLWLTEFSRSLENSCTALKMSLLLRKYSYSSFVDENKLFEKL